MVMGGALAVVAVGLLGVGAYFLLFSGDDKKDKKDKKDKPPTQAAADDQKPDEKPPDVPVASGVDVTNLLPKDSQAVALLNVVRTKDVAGIFPNSASKCCL